MAHTRKRRPGSTGHGAPDLQQSLTDAIRQLGRTVRGIYSHDSWRRRDVLTGRLHPARNLEVFIRDAHTAGAPIEDVLPIPAAIERFIRDLYDEGAELSLVDAFQAETEAQGRADVAQLAAVTAAGSCTGTLTEAAEALYHQRVQTDRAWRAVTAAVRRAQQRAAVRGAA